jgi:hypothetical protein
MDILVGPWWIDFYKYKYMVKKGVFACIVLPRPKYCGRLTNRCFSEEEEHEWELAPTTPQDDAWPEEAPEPPHQEELEEVLVQPQAEWNEPAHQQHEWYMPVPPQQEWQALPQQEWQAPPRQDW